MNRYRVLVLTVAISAWFLHADLQAQTFVPTTGNHLWNDNNNWGPSPPQPFPNTPGAAAVLPSPTGNLTIELGQPITIGSLEIMKPLSPDSGVTTITGTNTLTISGGTSSLINRGNTGLGATVIDVPVQFDATFNVDQESDEQLRFIEPLSGAGDLTIRRTGTGNGGRTVVLGAANTYEGDTFLSSVAAGDDWLIVRLNNASAIPAVSNLALGSSTVLEIASGNFTRALGTGAGQVHFTGGGRNGFAAFDANRTVNLGGNATPDPVVWGNAAGQANFSQLVLGVPTSNAMVDFVNPLDINTGGNRNIRSYNGTGPIDGRISGVISGNGQVTKMNDGALSFAGANVYSGGTRIEEGMLRLDHPNALPATGNVAIGQGATLGIGADTTPGDPNSDFARTLGTGSGEFQLTAIGNNNNQANAGLSAHGGNRSVVFNSGGTLVWGTNGFLSGTNAGTPSRNLILSDVTADGTLILKNNIDLNAATSGDNRTVVPRNGSAEIDAELSGVISGTGGLTQDNTGTLVLSAANTYSGNTSILRGRLLANNASGSATSSGTMYVGTNATLGGTGAVGGVVTVNSAGHIAAGSPGASIESLQLGGLTVETGSILDFDLGTPNGTPGINNDLLNVLGTTTLNGIGTVNLTNAGGLGAGTYTLIDYAGALAGADITGFLTQTPTGPAGFSYLLVDTGNTINLNVSLAPTNDADFNGDGIIDSADYVVWRKFTPATGTGTQGTGDANGDTNIDTLDYDEWFENYGSASPGGGSQGVPEPSAILLLSLAAPLLLGRTRRSIFLTPSPRRGEPGRGAASR